MCKHYLCFILWQGIIAPMFILENVPLSAYSTMRLGGKAAYLTEINDRSEIAQAIEWANQRQLPYMMIGEGSNIVWRDEGFPGLIMVNKILKFETFEEDAENLYITIGAGEHWDSVVERIVTMGYSGVEELSLIPGTAGATPVQNVGAYGREIADSLMTIEAFDTKEGKLMNMQAGDCAFGYRTSRFKTTDKGRFIISSITLHVTRTLPAPPFYEALNRYFDEHEITSFTPQIIRDAVIEIRSSKLPDPAIVANNGSFFCNPIISNDKLNELLEDHDTMVYWRIDDGTSKLSAAWLIDQVGFKNYKDAETGMATWPNQPLVLINEHAESTQDLLNFKQKIVNAVKEKFRVELQQEPELLP